MRQYFAAAAMLLAGCASTPEVRLDQTVTLRGILGNANCPANDLYNGTFAIVQLAEPMWVESLGRVDRVELVMGEYYFVQYGNMVGKAASVTCKLHVSGLCGFEQVMCGADTIRVEP